MDYKLIKLTEGYIIVSDVIPNKNDWFLHKTLSDTSIHKCIKVPIQFNVHGDDDVLFFSKYCFKIIASTFIKELPNIDFNNLQKEFDIVDVEQLAEDDWTYKEYGFEKGYNPKRCIDGAIQKPKFINGYVKGFNKCLELNKDKLYTEEQMLQLLEVCKESMIIGTTVFVNRKGKEYIQSLQPKMEWDIQIETEWIKDFTRGGFGGAGSIDIEKIKITNNKIKIVGSKR